MKSGQIERWHNLFEIVLRKDYLEDSMRSSAHNWFFCRYGILLIVLLAACTHVSSPETTSSPSGNGDHQSTTIDRNSTLAPAGSGTLTPAFEVGSPVPVSEAFITIPNSTDIVNLRSGPGISFDKIGELRKGETAPAVGQLPSGWIMIQYSGAPEGTAWIYGPLVELRGDLPDLSVPGSVEEISP